MKKTGYLNFIIGLFLIMLLINLGLAEIRINEIELNPSRADAGNEWIELYSDSLINVNGWKLVNSDNNARTLTQSFQGFLVINFSEQWLDNENESIQLRDSNDSLIFQTPIFKDSFDDSKSWSYCNSSWSLVSSSPGSANNCINNNSTPNNTQNTTLPISLQLDWDDEDIKNGDDFEIQIKALNLGNKDYDIQIYIYDNEESKTLSEIYNIDDEWASAKDRLKKFFSGPGNRTGYVKLRIKESKRDFSGLASIVAVIKEYGSSSEKARADQDIEIIRADNSDLTNSNKETSQASDDRTKVLEQIQDFQTYAQTTGNVVYLNGKSSSADIISLGSKKNTVYESGNEKIKTYSIYAFILLIILLAILFIFKR